MTPTSEEMQDKGETPVASPAMHHISMITLLGDILRFLVIRILEQSELILLRVLKFELRVSTPFDFLSGYLGEAMRDFGVDDGNADAKGYFDDRNKEKKEADRIADLMETGIAKDCKAKALNAYVRCAEAEIVH
ncbi:hypothetical protein SLS55_006382 [Diplodia seriata]|uniref:Uncharacterized protein n=1 Tax=Diplodia seriata TaxID=420778 RepID=A0ABR3CE32_9PEZI